MCGSSLVLAAPGLESRGADSSLWIAESVRFATKLKLSSCRSGQLQVLRAETVMLYSRPT